MQASRNGALASEEQTGGLMQVDLGGWIGEGLLGGYLLLVEKQSMTGGVGCPQPAPSDDPPWTL